MTESKAAEPGGLHPRLLKMLQVDALSVVSEVFECYFKSIVGVLVRLCSCRRLARIQQRLGRKLVHADVPDVVLGEVTGKGRPIGKYERIIRQVLESGGWLSEYQTGFNKGSLI